MASFSTIKAKPKQKTPLAEEEKTANSTVAEETVNANADVDGEGGDGMSTSAFIDFISSPREMPPIASGETDNAAKDTAAPGVETDAPNADTDAPNTETPDDDAGFVKRSWTWFKGAMDKDEGPVADELKVEMDEEMYGLTASLGTGFSETLISSLIARMHGDKKAEEFKLKDEVAEGSKRTERSRLNHAWELFFRSIRLRVTPLTYLIGVMAQIWGLPLLGGFMKYWTRMSVFGFHWPWSEAWKLKAQKKQQAKEQAAEVAEAKKAEAPAPSPEAPKTPEPKPEDTVTNLQICRFWQWQTDNGKPITTEKVFQKGKGSPRTGKDKSMIDKFGSYPAYVAYQNAVGNIGKRK
jgi:hypothetical protein